MLDFFHLLLELFNSSICSKDITRVESQLPSMGRMSFAIADCHTTVCLYAPRGEVLSLSSNELEEARTKEAQCFYKNIVY